MDNHINDLVSVLTFGEPLITMAHDGNENLAVNRSFTADCAGAELNTAIALARLNVPVAYAAALGADPFGDLLLRELRAEGVDVSRVEQTEKGTTGVLFKIQPGLQNDPSVFYYRSQTPMAKGMWMSERCVSDLKHRKFSWVHSTGIAWMLSDKTRQQAQRVFVSAFESGIPISFDINIRLKMAGLDAWRDVLKEVIPYVHWFFVGDTEARWLFSTDEVREIVEALHDYGFRGEGVILKQGELGATALRAGRETHIAAWPVSRVIDSVGAGDGFNAGMIAGLLRGWGLEKSLTLASLIGAHAVTSLGDSSGYPMWSSIARYFTGDEEIVR